MARDAQRCPHAPTTGCRWRHPGNEEPPAERAGLQFHDVKQPNLKCRICAGAGYAPLNNTSRFRGAWAPRFDPFAAAPNRGAAERRQGALDFKVAPARRDSHVREAWAHLARVRAPLGAPHGDFWPRPALHLRRCRRIRRAWCARPGVVPGERGPKPPEPAISAAVQDATPAPSSGSSPETPLVERDG